MREYLCGDSGVRLFAERSHYKLAGDFSGKASGSLLLEQIFERLSRVVGPQTGGRRRFFFSGYADLIQRAVVARIFLWDSHRHGLHALKPAAGVEIRTLLARMQFKTALRTLPTRRHSLQYGAALRAS